MSNLKLRLNEILIEMDKFVVKKDKERVLELDEEFDFNYKTEVG